MKKFAFLFLVAVLLFISADDLLARNGAYKTKNGMNYNVAGVRGGKPQGVVFMFHGQGGNGGQAAGIFSGAASQGGFITIAPTSLRDGWNTADFPDFVEMLDNVAAMTPVNFNRIHTVGHSAGAGIAIGFAIGRPDLISSAGCFNGSFPQGGATVASLNPSEEAKTVPIYWSVGTADKQIHIQRVRQLVKEYESLGFDITLKEHGGGHQPNGGHIGEWGKWKLDKRKEFMPGQDTSLSWTTASPEEVSGDALVVYLYHSKMHKNNDDLAWIESGIFAHEELNAHLQKFTAVRADLKDSDAWKTALELKKMSPGVFFVVRGEEGWDVVASIDAKKASPKAMFSALKKAAKKAGIELD